MVFANLSCRGWCGSPFGFEPVQRHRDARPPNTKHEREELMGEGQLAPAARSSAMSSQRARRSSSLPRSFASAVRAAWVMKTWT